MNRKTWNANPSRDLSYTSLIIDEQNRSQHSHKITDTARFRATPTNGNLAVVVPDIDDATVRQSLPKHLQVDTNTRTVFRDVFYRPKEGITEFVEDPAHSCAAVRALPHMPMNELAPTDPRIRKLKPAYESPLCPGYYEPDPLGERSTGTLTIDPGEVHHTIQYARDPNRPSAVFTSAKRGHTAREIAAAAVSPPIISRMTDPDFAYWTSKGCWAPRGERVIEADRWGKNARETRPPAEDRPQSVYTPAVTTDGHPNSCEAYTSARLSPAYKVAFASGMPRTIALPLGLRPDTRLQIKSYDDITAARPDVGPGSYNPEAPRMRSPNAAYDTSSAYYSLASGTPTGPNPHWDGHQPSGSAASASGAQLAALLPPQLQQQLAASGALASLVQASAPHTPGNLGGRSAGGTPLTSAHQQQQQHPSSARSEPCSPSAARAAAIRAERVAAAAMMATVSHGGGARDSLSRAWSPSPLGTPQTYGGAGGAGGGSYGSAAGQQQHLMMPYSYGEEDDGGLHLPSPSWPRAQSAPVSPRRIGSATSAMRAAQSKQFNKLVFMQRHTPCSSLLRSHLVVA
ncbi:hypothetical protein Agub_g1906, partial [Astrephomene gubernaculifera]